MWKVVQLLEGQKVRIFWQSMTSDVTSRAVPERPHQRRRVVHAEDAGARRGDRGALVAARASAGCGLLQAHGARSDGQ